MAFILNGSIRLTAGDVTDRLGSFPKVSGGLPNRSGFSTEGSGDSPNRSGNFSYSYGSLPNRSVSLSEGSGESLNRSGCFISGYVGENLYMGTLYFSKINSKSV